MEVPVPHDEARWDSSREFLARKLEAAKAELATVILNRSRWDKVRDETRLLTHLNARAATLDFQGIREELNRIAEGRMRVPELSAPRTQASNYLQLWEPALLALDQPVTRPVSRKMNPNDRQPDQIQTKARP
jgi:hypothetical protein